MLGGLCSTRSLESENLAVSWKDSSTSNGLGRRRARRGLSGVALLCAAVATTIAFAKDQALALSDPTLDVRVTFEGKPVAGAQVVAIDVDNLIRTLTDRDGKAQLRLAADGKINRIVALDPKLGVGGRSFEQRTIPTPPGTVLELSLAPARPYTIRLVDDKGKPVRLASISVASVVPERGWLQTGVLDATHLHTDSRGEALVPWIPREVKSVGVDLTDDRWKLDEVDRSQTANRLTSVKVRRLHAVDGRLSMPDGSSPEGLLITGTGIGTSAMGHNLSARVRKDGSFTLYVAADHAYSLCLVDDKWASDSWTGVILTSDEAAPKELNFAAYEATPLSVRVTRGPKHEPVQGAWVNVSSGDRFWWQDARGERQIGDGGPQRGVYTDKQGRAQFAVGKGKQELFLATGNWREPKTIKVASDEPISVDFYRPWADKRTIPGRLILQNRPYKAGAGTIVRAWNLAPPKVTAEAPASPDGRFTLAIDAAEVYLLAVDPKNLLAGSRLVTAKEATADLELRPMGSVSGQVVDSRGEPLVGQGVELVFAGPDFRMWQIVLQSTTVDERGHFKLDSVPAGIPLRVCVGTPASARGAAFAKRPDNFQVHSSRELTLEPGEVRENVKLVKRIRRGKG
jgi:hypothetical protein